jgi:hypothetical protein
MTRPGLTRTAVFLATAVASWGLLVAATSVPENLSPGTLADRDYRARFAASVEDRDKTAADEEEAAAAVLDVYEHRGDIEDEVYEQLEFVVGAVKDGVIDTSVTPTTFPEPTPSPSTTAGVPSETTLPSTSTTQAELVEATGWVFLDVDADGEFSGAPDAGLDGIGVLLSLDGGAAQRVETQSDGSWSSMVAPGNLVVTIDGDDPDWPAHLGLSTANARQELDCTSECETAAMGYRPLVRSIDEQVAELSQSYSTLKPTTLQTLAVFGTEDVARSALGQDLYLDAVKQAATLRLQTEFAASIAPEDLLEVGSRLFTNPPVVFVGGERDVQAGEAAADLANLVLAANYLIDSQATELARQEARDAVEPTLVGYAAQQYIVREGEQLQQIDIDAINQTGAATGQAQQEWGMLAVISVLVAVIGFYLGKFRPDIWNRPRMIALLGLLIVLSALAVRGTIEMQAIIDDPSAWYLLPGVAVGLMAAILFDARIGLLVALGIGALAATGTRDPGVAVFALLAGMIPIGFVSSLASRKAIRNAVVFSSLAAAVIAGAVAWFFHTNPDENPTQTVLTSAGWAFGASILTALLGLAILQFFESAFDVTTSLRLLELGDRNHEALLLLQEEAFGTFNHSLMVGTLADAAARAVGANPLLAKAAAYYHDLGKTEDPTMFIENQFGMNNPHDDLPPEQSVEIIRRHVTAGVELARKYKIPPEVAEGIVTHHGDGIMRFFFERARARYGDENVNPDDYRHVGHKPQSAEMAIVMLADSLEAACRAVFQEEDPTPMAIEKVVDRVVDEKINDGQLSESSLTLDQLNRVRRAFLDSLVGHYHQRIPYPNFPGS